MRRLLLPLAVTFLIAAARIVATYPVFNQTWDEPAHVAAGMEWLDRGSYTYEPLHPPLARVMAAVGPRLAGIRSARHENVWIEGNAILHAGGRYDRNLALARLGMLPFFLLASAVVFAWARRLGGGAAAAAARLLFTTLPPVLAHAGIATTDIAITSTVVLACYAAVRWLEQPTARRSVLVGATIGAALLSKLSALLFLPAAAAGIAVCRWRDRNGTAKLPGTPTRTATLRLTYAVALLTVWAGYRFAIGPLVSGAAVQPAANPAASTPLERLARAPVFPAPALFEGLGNSRQRTARATSPTCSARSGARAGGTSSPWRSG